MSKVKVLVTTMHQDDISLLYKKMNLQTDTVFANQTDHNDYAELSINGHQVKFVSTDKGHR